jgi:hypothetical protein
MVIVPVFNINMSNQKAIAQSQSATQQQTSQPSSSSQNNSNSTLQIGQVFTFNEKSKPPNNPQLCADLAKVVKGKAVPDYNLCDVVVYRQSPPIIRHDGLVMNNFSGFGHYIEFVPASALNNTKMYSSVGSSNVSKDKQNALFGEFALLDSEVVPVRKVMEKYNWTETALHNHMLGETPKVLFLHWSVNGEPMTIINQAKEILMQTSTYQNQTGNSRTPSTAGP